MILKASQRSGAKQLGLHLLKTEENEHVEIHEVSGFGRMASPDEVEKIQEGDEAFFAFAERGGRIGAVFA